MKKVISTEKIPIKPWLEDIEEKALQQAKNLANLPFAFKHIVILPDCHQGYGMPIGAVLAAKNTVVPNCVGVDIGCGVCAVQTNLKSIETETLKQILGQIRKAIPLGFKHHKIKQKWNGFDRAPHLPIIQQELNSARYQLGSLGGGNHFIEIQKGSDGFIWIMLHSGSRNFGFKIAQEYHRQALNYCQQYNLNLPDKELAYLSLDNPQAQEYLAAMNFALDFAKANRALMLEKIKQIIQKIIPQTTFGQTIDIHHNYAAEEVHFGKKVMVHRKGATSAKKGQLGIIPGSQGSKSYIVKGKGKPDSFLSCSHGAGRKMGRKQAIRELNLKKEIKRLEDQSIIHTLRHQSDLEEAVSAYKDISKVMEDQKDLVEIITELSPLAVIKG